MHCSLLFSGSSGFTHTEAGSFVLQANSEVSALLGRIPSAVGYQPTLATDLGGLQERITTTKAGSITSVQAVYVPADDLTDPAPATTFAHLDATTVLSRQIAELGIYPAVDPLDSTSRMLDKRILGEAHYNCARQVQKVLQDYKNLQVCIAVASIFCFFSTHANLNHRLWCLSCEWYMFTLLLIVDSSRPVFPPIATIKGHNWEPVCQLQCLFCAVPLRSAT
jgi:hypothetical protein